MRRKRSTSRLPSHLRLKIYPNIPCNDSESDGVGADRLIHLNWIIEDEVFGKPLLFFCHDQKLNLEYGKLLYQSLFITYADECNTNTGERLLGFCEFDDLIMNSDNQIHAEEQFGAACLTAIINKIRLEESCT